MILSARRLNRLHANAVGLLFDLSVSFPDRSGLFGKCQGQMGGPVEKIDLEFSTVSPAGELVRGYSSVDRASRSQRFFAVL